MTVKEITGDLFSTDATMIGHGVNCKGAMKSGIAIEFRSRFDDMHEIYMSLCETESLIPGDVFFYEDKDSGWTIANIASQLLPGKNAKYTWAIKGIGSALDHAQSFGHSALAIPRIGCGVGGLDWKMMRQLILAEFDEHPVGLLVYSRNASGGLQ